MSAITLAWLIGIVVGIILVLIILMFVNKDGRLKTKYDERQLLVRGKAYKYGFFACLISNAVFMFFMTGDFGFEVFGYSIFFFPILIGVTVQVTYCIFKDGYVGLNTNMTRFIIIIAVIGVLNFALFFRSLFAGDLIINGRMQGPFLNLLCGLLLIIVAVELFIKKLLDAREG